MQVHLQGLIFKFAQGRAAVDKLYKKAGIVGFVVLSFLVQLMFSHNATYFLILDGKSCLRLLSKVHYLPQIILILMVVLFTVLPVHKSKKPHKNDNSTPSVEIKNE